MSDSASTTQGLTRRELLKRGAALGGALAWATPAVQLIGMQPAMASHVSDLCICVKFDASDDQQNAWTSIGTIGTEGTCLESPSNPGCDTDFNPDSSFIAGDCSGADADTFCIQKNSDGSWDLYFPLYCSLIDALAKCGSGCCTLHTNFGPTVSGDRNVWHIDPVDLCTCGDAGGSQSHFEFCFQC